MVNSGAKIYFSDFYEIEEKTLSDYGAFNISPVIDLPLFIDPFLLFTSDNPEYQKLHNDIIEYLTFLRDKSVSEEIQSGDLKSWYCFKEVHQNCLGFCLNGTHGAGLGIGFANALNINLQNIFKSFGKENITQSSHLEKLVLIRNRVGKDNISDFTTNLIKGFLLAYTETFTLNHLKPEFYKEFNVPRSYFNYDIGVWADRKFTLPVFGDDFVVLTPEDILTKDEIWINKKDLRRDFSRVRNSIDNSALRSQIDHYFRSILPKQPTLKETAKAKEKTFAKYPELIDYFIKYKEDKGDEARYMSSEKVSDVAWQFIEQVKRLMQKCEDSETISKISTVDETLKKILFLQQIIENEDGYKIFYDKKGIPIQRESDLQILFKLVWQGSLSSVDSEVNNGRGPVDFKISNGAKDSTLVEFKLAKNSKLKQNLENQVPIYKNANRTTSAYKVILYFSNSEKLKLHRILNELGISDSPEIILIDATPNKVSASNAKNTGK